MSIGILANATLMFRRKSGGSVVDGYWVGEAEGTPFPAIGSLQPLTPKQMEALPEGRRNRQSYSFWTETPALQTVQNSSNPDVTTIDGDVYEVYSCAGWIDPILSHYHAILQKVEGVQKSPPPPPPPDPEEP